MLKLYWVVLSLKLVLAAASARLCVETYDKIKNKFGIDAAASARLCVETYPFLKIVAS